MEPYKKRGERATSEASQGREAPTASFQTKCVSRRNFGLVTSAVLTIVGVNSMSMCGHSPAPNIAPGGFQTVKALETRRSRFQKCGSTASRTCVSTGCRKSTETTIPAPTFPLQR